MQELIELYFLIGIFIAMCVAIESETENELILSLKVIAALLLWPLYIILILSHIAWERITSKN
jgi:hypothetical protein